MNDNTTAQAEIEAILNNWATGIKTLDTDKIMENVHPNVVMFDAIPPAAARNSTEYRKGWEGCMPYLEAGMSPAMKELEIEASGDLAFARFFFKMDANVADGAGSTWVRTTICYRRENGKWLEVHSHFSIPFDPMTNQAVLLTDADLKDKN